MTAVRRPWGSVQRHVRDTLLTAVDQQQARAHLATIYSKRHLEDVIGLLRKREEIPPFAPKHDVINVTLSPALRRRMHALAGQRDISARRVAARALLLGLEAMERRP